MFKTVSKTDTDKESEYAIEVKNVSKRFKIPHEKRTTVYDNLFGKITGSSYNYEVFEALKDVSFTVKKGETLGIIGENGSGKSTLLKMLAGVLVPDTGSVKVWGKMAPFLELGVGFQPELTAVENVYLYGAIMGLNRKEMDANLASIFEFAELDRFRNAKLKNFSSGMYARLAFATAISTNPDVLLLDEVLAVGDESFQKKCHDKIDEYRQNKKTIVFVSHSLGTVGELCERSILIDKGVVKSEGYSEKVINDYNTKINNKEEFALKQQQKDWVEVQNLRGVTSDAKVNTEKVKNQDNLGQNRWGSREIEITGVKFLDNTGKEKYIFKTDEPMIVKIEYFATEKIEKPVFGVAIHTNDGIHINGPNTKTSGYSIQVVEGIGEIYYSISALPLLDGIYYLSAAIYDYTRKHAYDHHHKIYKFKVIRGNIMDDLGIFYIPCEWKIKV